MRWWELKKELQVCETMTPSYAVPVFRLKSLWGNPSFSMTQADKNFCKILDDQSKFTIFLTMSPQRTLSTLLMLTARKELVSYELNIGPSTRTSSL